MMTVETNSPRLIALFSDFGNDGPYLGQVEALLAASAVQLQIVNLLSNAPAFNPRASAYLLAALAKQMPIGTVFLAVVDPGVGGKRLPLVVQTEHQWFIGPDNGLLSQVVRRSAKCSIQVVEGDRSDISNTFHCRDIFAPAAVAICEGRPVAGPSLDADSIVGADWPEDLTEIIYIDHYGNAFTGLRASSVTRDDVLECSGTLLHNARTFCEAAEGQPFWYENSCGLVELAVNQGSIVDRLGLALGDRVSLVIT